jgi:hypothetical protein
MTDSWSIVLTLPLCEGLDWWPFVSDVHDRKPDLLVGVTGLGSVLAVVVMGALGFIISTCSV